MHISLCTGGLQWHKMNRKCAEHPSSCLLTTAAEEKQTSHRLLFLFFLVFSGHDINEFVTDLIVDNVVRYEQILINVWLPCMVNVQHSVFQYLTPDSFTFQTVSNMKRSKFHLKIPTRESQHCLQ